MKKFSFRLEALLRHRHHLEEKERTRFSGIRKELLAEMDHVRALRTKQGEVLAELTQKKSGDCDSQEIAWHYHFLDRLALELERSARRVAELDSRLEIQKQVMIEAMRGKKMIENLKIKREKEFLTSLDRTEQKSVDEIVVTRYAHKQ
jgi:flagellar export protein FliJ